MSVPALQLRLVALLGCTLCLLGCFLGGCGTNSYNRELTLGNRVELEAVTPGVPRGLAAPLPERPDRPSLNPATLDRADWSQRLVLVPIDGTTHRPNYSDRLEAANLIARDRGEFPTIDSAIDTSVQGSATQKIVEGVRGPFHSAVSLALMPIHMFQEPPFDPVSSPQTPKPRYNYPGGLGVVTQSTRMVRALTPPDQRPQAAPEPVEAPASGPPTTSPANPPPAIPATAPAKADDSGMVWIYRDGKWIRVPKSEVTPR